MIALDTPDDFDDWRDQARMLLQARAEPDVVSWGEETLFRSGLPPSQDTNVEIRVPAAFVKLAQTVFMHSDPSRLSLLYRLLWRLQGNRYLLDDATDAEVKQAGLMAKAIRRDIHKMRAFVRFREVQDDAGECRYIAWFEPDHDIVRANVSFFIRRFGSMQWTILTPKLCIHWDRQVLRESIGIAKPVNMADDPGEELWRSYYASTFNPARLKTKAMLKEMPRRYWKNMPETQLIPGLIAGAQAREAAMVAMGRGSEEAPPQNFVELKQHVDNCARCPLYRDATQAVHGAGPHHARLMIVGEQPGDKEDLAGQPFIGPAGQILNNGLAAAGIDRSQTYLTNAVKHFKHEQRGKLRLHQAPTAGEIDHCRWWLDAERKLVKPQWILALGASAVRAILGKTISISKMRGQPMDLGDGSILVATTHPSYILRIGDDHREAAMVAFINDLNVIRHLMQ
jgi:uracil-DNA glycosylase